jgi:hypothetical protein
MFVSRASFLFLFVVLMREFLDRLLHSQAGRSQERQVSKRWGGTNLDASRIQGMPSGVSASAKGV